MSRKGWLLFIALCVIWGIPYLLIRVAVRELPPPALIFLRTAPAALLLVPLALHRGELRPLLARWRWVIAYTLVEIAVPWLLLSHAELRLSSSLAGLLVAAVPLIAALALRYTGGRCASVLPSIHSRISDRFQPIARGASCSGLGNSPRSMRRRIVLSPRPVSAITSLRR